MNTPDLISVCITSMVSVFVILSLLAIFMKLLIISFPEKKTEDDAPLFTAITSAYKVKFPNAKIIKIGEQK